MRPILLVLIVALTVLGALAVHIFRDVRGKARNLRGACYSCGTTEGTLHAVVHTAQLYGVAYLYCSRCATRQIVFKTTAVSIMISLGAATLATASISIVEENLLGAILLAGGALLLVGLVITYARQNLSRAGRSSFADAPGLGRYIGILRVLHTLPRGSSKTDQPVATKTSDTQ